MSSLGPALGRVAIMNMIEETNTMQKAEDLDIVKAIRFRNNCSNSTQKIKKHISYCGPILSGYKRKEAACSNTFIAKSFNIFEKVNIRILVQAKRKCQ